MAKRVTVEVKPGLLVAAGGWLVGSPRRVYFCEVIDLTRRHPAAYGADGVVFYQTTRSLEEFSALLRGFGAPEGFVWRAADDSQYIGPFNPEDYKRDEQGDYPRGT